jgi:hypothetical protein
MLYTYFQHQSFYFMKKSILLLSGLFMSLYSFAQLQVSTTPENKKALLEEFTGIKCTFCPDGHLRAQNIKNTHGANFWVINIHVGSFAVPSAGEPDFRTPFGTGISGQTGLTGYPAGTVNRQLFSGLSQGSGTAMGRTNWANATNQVRNQPAYVNIAVEAEVDDQTRQLRVITKYYYTDSSSLPTNKLNIALLQNNFEGPQTGMSANPGSIMPNGKYKHMHFLRHMLTGQWGVDITNTSMGSTATDTFYYTVPAALNGVAYELGNLEVVAFIAEGQQEVINVNGANVTVVNPAVALDGNLMQVENILFECGTISPWVKLKNNGGTALTSVEFTYSANGGTPAIYTWNGNLAYSQVAYITLPALSYTAASSNNYSVSITAVNGGADPITTNNSASDAFNQATETTKSNITIKITLDGYGSETSWALRNSAGTTVSSGGPYTDAGSNGAFAQPDINLTLPNDCYTFQINDSYGDGLCCTYGNGGYEIWADGVLIPGMSGSTFTSTDIKKFAVNASAPTAIEEAVENTFRLFPNPTGNEFNVSFQNTVSEGIIRVTDLQGRVVLSDVINNVDFHKMDVSQLANGMYIVVINADGKTTNEKLSVLK